MQGFDRDNEDPTGWYMSEKLNGIRAYWDGKQFWSKNGVILKRRKKKINVILHIGFNYN
jgi:hypothetical protein